MKTTAGVFNTQLEAESALAELMRAGVPKTDISYLHLSNGKVVNDTTGASVGDKAAKGAATGTALGVLAGLAVVNGVLPGLGTLIVAGPIAASLGLTGAAATTAAAAATGLAAGGLVGALTGYGISQNDASTYEQLVKKGNSLLIVKTSNPIAVKTILLQHGAKEVREYTA